MSKDLLLVLDKIEKIMDKEMAKDPNEMNGNLVDACVYILSKVYIKNNVNV